MSLLPNLSVLVLALLILATSRRSIIYRIKLGIIIGVYALYCVTQYIGFESYANGFLFISIIGGLLFFWRESRNDYEALLLKNNMLEAIREDRKRRRNGKLGENVNFMTRKTL